MKRFMVFVILLIALTGCNAKSSAESMHDGIRTVSHTDLCLSTIQNELSIVNEGFYFIRDTQDNAYFYIYSKARNFEQMSISNQMIDKVPHVIFTATTKNLVYHYDEPKLDGFMAVNVNEQVGQFKFMVDGNEIYPQIITSRIQLESAR
ncbi:hypothetical protein LLS04_01610 [Erysipelothrix enhydrae]|uniref:hypothetical protein n=1 Tax=Erysipelothrix enhydrae TaxID=2890314 RepID=UPI002B2426A8|nr:hypothetical protein [Erysipelothrix sp. 4322-04]WRB87301.1 hypothetical protein LLS04_01610 [Erysipelothrix sp. 4322-04]